MSEQSGRGEPAGRPGSGQPRGAERQGSGRSQQPGRREPGTDVLSDLQRWLIRSGARSMRSQFEDQVRRTISGQRPDNSDVWDIATTEPPPEAGEAPECQWCPICRAARRMRDTRPGLAGQLTGAGDAVAAAVQDAVRAFETFLTRAAGSSAPDAGPDTSTSQEEERGDGGGIDSDADRPRPAPHQPSSGEGGAARPDSLAGEHGPVGWKPGDRLSTAGAAVADTWAGATEPDEPADHATGDGATTDGGIADGGTNGGGTNPGGTNGGGTNGGGTNAGGSPGRPTSGGPDGRGHGSSDRG